MGGFTVLLCGDESAPLLAGGVLEPSFANGALLPVGGTCGGLEPESLLCLYFSAILSTKMYSPCCVVDNPGEGALLSVCDFGLCPSFGERENNEDEQEDPEELALFELELPKLDPE